MRGRRLTAATADRWTLYERSVQEPEADCDLVEQVWRELRGREPRLLREDFCGTAVSAIEWVKRDRRHEAIAVDLSPEALAIAARRVRKRLRPADRARIELVRGDVRKIRTRRVDTIVACNFSYFAFRTRPELRRYFRACRAALVDDGMLLLDAYGGSDAYLEIREKREEKGFTYVWDQHSMNPLTGHVTNHIHFHFRDGTKLERAFTYEWRLWTLPELIELLREAGFPDVTVYWEGSDETGGGVGVVSVT
ncbi:MAG: class I SAM-dependent methyltransferase [Planctomycetota bacterium]